MTTSPETPGRDKPKCGGTKRDGSGGLCKRPAGWGTDHPGIGKCKLHGGSTPNHKTAARIVQARRDVATYGLPIDVEPGLALLQEVHRTAGHVAWLGAKVAELDEADLVWGVTEEVDKGASEYPGTDTTRAAKPNMWLALYQQERKHLVDVSAATVRAGVDKAIVKLTEQQGALIAGAISRILDALELSPSQRARVPEVVPGVLLEIAGEAGQR